MITFTFLLRNPLPHAGFQALWSKEGQLSTNKFYSIDFYKCADEFLGLELSTHLRGSDHAGPRFSVNLFGYTAVFQIYDRRHWNYKTNDWERIVDQS